MSVIFCYFPSTNQNGRNKQGAHKKPRNRITCPGRYSGFQVTGMIKWLQKSKPKNIPRAPKINLKKIPCRIFEPNKVFKIFQKAVNDKVRKIN